MQYRRARTLITLERVLDDAERPAIAIAVEDEHRPMALVVPAERIEGMTVAELLDGGLDGLVATAADVDDEDTRRIVIDHEPGPAIVDRIAAAFSAMNRARGRGPGQGYARIAPTLARRIARSMGITEDELQRRVAEAGTRLPMPGPAARLDILQGL